MQCVIPVVGKRKKICERKTTTRRRPLTRYICVATVKEIQRAAKSSSRQQACLK